MAVQVRPPRSKQKRYKMQELKDKGGRPYTEIDWVQVEKLCGIHCTGEEIANILGFSYDTLERAVKREYNTPCAEWIKQKGASGRASLRRVQYSQAMGGNTTMLVWLGKNWLGQTDKQEVTAKISEITEFEVVEDQS